ncbi:LuxR C-terminal-related transcriptional regulator [Kriegella aquimaris]|uniref:Homeodomain-like domain-containing protein n=1 Tax=Kriegella aquimaris TaxID=192904 RepID=A0A1G9RFB7_9FLAO|nr:helix-turn-helix domain-containing protein [Kriegella aquimaris]SDM21155.1 Homeodomain-like domain-containing protein [Kriegella aquimaris]
MANTLDPMDLKHIITLHLDGYSNRKIGTALGISRNTVNTYMGLFKGSDHTFKELLSFDNARLTCYGLISSLHFKIISWFTQHTAPKDTKLNP